MLKSKKILSILLVTIFMLTSATNVFASDLKTKLYVTQASSEIKQLENEQGEISKTIVNSNSDSGEVTIELKLFNSKKVMQETEKETEIILVIDNSPSMDFVTASGATRKEIVIPAAKKLVESIFSKSNNVKIGVVEFSGGSSIYSATYTMCNLTNNKDNVIYCLNRLNNQSTSGGTNILAGLKKANSMFSSECENKVIVLLSDGVPNYDLSYNSALNDTTTEESKIIQENTRAGLIEVANSGTYIISMMTGMSAEDGNTDKSGTVYTGTSSIEDDLKAVQKIFGTQANPTTGKYYLVKSADVNSIIQNDIFNDVMSKIENPIKQSKIVDYFPTDITENFEFSYDGKPSMGTVSSSIDPNTKTITWDIGTLNNQETATLRYKLKIKDMKNENLLNKTIATNEKVVLTYTDYTDKNYEVVLNSSPKITLKEQANLESIQITKEPNKTEYTVGEKFSNAGMEVMANYSDGSKINVTDKCTYSPAEALKKADTQITVKYTEDGVTKEAKQVINVKDKVVENNNNNNSNNNNNVNNTKKDNTIATGNIPYTGGTFVIIASTFAIIAVGAYVYKRNKDFKGI